MPEIPPPPPGPRYVCCCEYDPPGLRCGPCRYDHTRCLSPMRVA